MRPFTQLISITFADDSVGVMSFVTVQFDKNGRPAWVREPTRAAVDEEIARSEFGLGKKPIKGWRIISAPDVPADRSYRGAWKDDGKAIDHDMAKAREIHRDRLRRERGQVMPDLDAEYMKALESSDAARMAAIAARKQALRDAPADPRIEAAQTVEELKQVKLPE